MASVDWLAAISVSALATSRSGVALKIPTPTKQHTYAHTGCPEATKTKLIFSLRKRCQRRASAHFSYSMFPVAAETKQQH